MTDAGDAEGDPAAVLDVATVPWGVVRSLVVDSDWDAEIVRACRSLDANSVIWTPPRDGRSDCRGLLEVADLLVDVHVAARTPLGDSALGELTGLRSLVALTRARNALDLTTLTQVDQVTVDDRPGLVLPRGDRLRSVTVFRSRRQLADLVGAPALTHLRLVGPRAHVVRMETHLPALTSLVVEGGRVLSLSGLDAPRLQDLRLIGKPDGSEALDLSPLASLPELRTVAVSRAAAVTGLGGLVERSEVEVRIGRDTAVDGTGMSEAALRVVEARLARF